MSPSVIVLSLLFLSVAHSTAMDPYKFLHIILNPNDTITRLEKYPETPATPDPNPHLPVLSKDLTINPSRNTWARIYLPHQAPNHSSSSSLTKLPIIVFYHGGGFIFYAANSTYFHDFCVQLALRTQSVVVSVNYRLAPENRLPAAYDDALEALHWIRTSEDKWLTGFADYSKCYLMGESAGGNIAYNAGLRAAAEVDQLEPVKIEGLILVQPFFGGVKRTSSEERLANDTNLPQPVTDLMWELSLPVGADRDHEYSNPTGEKSSKGFDNIARLGWKVIVFGCYGDPLIDRQIDLAKSLQEHDADAEGHFQGEDKHGVFVGQPTKGKAIELYDTCYWCLFESKQRGFIMEEDQSLDPYKHLKLVRNHDSTITRLRVDPPISPASDPSLLISVLTKDIMISPEFNVYVRIFLPRKALDNSSPKLLLPLILYFHGGGFILFSAASSMFHDFCVNMADAVQAIVVSLDYRLAPEHRLPAAYDDAMQALHWIKTNQDDWLKEYADYSSSYLMGSSAGANIAYHAALRVAAGSERDEPLKIRGLILVQPFVGGMERSGSELRLANDPVLPLCVSDLMWELTLPVGSNRDHEYCNPTAGRDDDKKMKMERMRGFGWRVMVVGFGGDPLVDRQKEMVTWMEENGVKVDATFEAGYNHGVEIRNPAKQKELFSKIKNFVGSLSSA